MTFATNSVHVLFVSDPTYPAVTSLSQRFGAIIEGLCRVVAARGGKQHELVPLVVLLWSRLRRMAARFDALATRPRLGPPAPASLRPSRAAANSPAMPQYRLPQGFAWLVRLMQETAVYGSYLQQLLADPEMSALLEAEPRLGRILRPLCRMLAVRPLPEHRLALPRRTPPGTRKPRPAKPRPRKRGFSAVLLSGSPTHMAKPPPKRA